MIKENGKLDNSEELISTERIERKSILTFQMLENADIQLKIVTTNLSMRRPYTFPCDLTDYYFKTKEFAELFPTEVMAYLEEICPLNTKDIYGKPVPEPHRRFPNANDVPIIVAVRMSLSFPILLAAVPLYVRDKTYDQGPQRTKLRRCWFSDGGISSNFPIHLFDSFLPSRPTFAIALDEHSTDRQGGKNVWMPPVPKENGSRSQDFKDADRGLAIPVKDIDSLPDFIFSILNSAKDWQDVLQSRLAGYRERIAHVALTDKEGGLNLKMPHDRVKALSAYGHEAGQLMLEFDFDEHRWLRYIVAIVGLEKKFTELSKKFGNNEDEASEEEMNKKCELDQNGQFLEKHLSFSDFLLCVDHCLRDGKTPQLKDFPYPQDGEWRKDAEQMTRYLMDWLEKQKNYMSEGSLSDRGKIPRPETVIRMTPGED